MIVAGREVNLEPHLVGLFCDEEEIRLAGWQTGPGDIVMDVGCYLGNYTIPALIRGSYVIAVDPYTGYLDKTWQICQDSDIDTSHLTTVCAALTGPGGYTPEFWNFVNSSQWPDLVANGSHAFTTMDQLAAQLELERLDWVKIDVEGAELDVLRGGEQSLRRYHPKLVIEDHTDIYPYVKEMDSAGQCQALLADMSYQVKTMRYEDGRVSRDFWICT